MVLPLVAGGAMLGAAAYNAYQNKQAGIAARHEREKLEKLLSNIQDPNFDTSQITPEEYEAAEKYQPELAQYIAEKNPQLPELSSEGKQSRQARMDILGQMRQASQSGKDPIAELQRSKALREAGMQAQTQRENITQDANRRGIGVGSGLALAGQMESSGRAMQGASMAGEQAAADAYGRRLQMMGQAGNLAGQIEGDDYNQASRNADIINAFNQRLASGQRDVAGQNLALRNAAISNAQRTGQMNTGLRNQSAIRQQDLNNQIAQQKHGNAMNRYGAQAGLGQMNRSDIMDAARQRSEAVSGAANAIGTGAQGYYQYQQDQGANQRANDQLAMQKDYYGSQTNLNKQKADAYGAQQAAANRKNSYYQDQGLYDSQTKQPKYNLGVKV